MKEIIINIFLMLSICCSLSAQQSLPESNSNPYKSPAKDVNCNLLTEVKKVYTDSIKEQNHGIHLTKINRNEYVSDSVFSQHMKIVDGDFSQKKLNRSIVSLLNANGVANKGNRNKEKLIQYSDTLETYKENILSDSLESIVESIPKIFEDNSGKKYQDKEKLELLINRYDQVIKEQTDLMSEIEDDEIANYYHQLLSDQIESEEFSRQVRATYNFRRDKAFKHNGKQLVRKVERLEKQKEEIESKISSNDFHKQLKDKYSDELETYDFKKYHQQLNQLINEEELVEVPENWQFDNEQNEVSNLSFDDVTEEVIPLAPPFEKMVLKDQKKKLADDLSGKIEKNEVAVHEFKDQSSDKFLKGKAFFEGVLSFADSDFKTFSFAPSFSYLISPNWSMGLGVTFHHTSDELALIKSALDYKLVSMYQFSGDLFFLKAEYITLLPGISYLKAEKELTSKEHFQHTALIGAGFNIKLKKKAFFNLSIMYNLNQNLGLPTYDSPFLARFGIKPF